MELDRQNSLKLNIPDSVCVVGCGGIGNWVALYLTLMGVRSLCLFDGDKVEIHNLNRTIFSKADIGEYKTDALKKILNAMRSVSILSFTSECSSIKLDSLIEKPDVFMDCTDRHEVQLTMAKWCENNKVRYIRVGANTNHITVTSNVNTWGESKQEQCGVTIPSWVAPVALVAAYAITKLALNSGLEVSMSLDDENTIPDGISVGEREGLGKHNDIPVYRTLEPFSSPNANIPNDWLCSEYREEVYNQIRR